MSDRASAELLFNLNGITRLVLPNLKLEEVVNCSDGFRRGAGKRNLSAVVGWLEQVLNLEGHALHDRNAGRDLIVHQHGNVEVALCKCLRDVGQVPADLIATRLRLWGP